MTGSDGGPAFVPFEKGWGTNYLSLIDCHASPTTGESVGHPAYKGICKLIVAIVIRKLLVSHISVVVHFTSLQPDLLPRFAASENKVRIVAGDTLYTRISCLTMCSA